MRVCAVVSEFNPFHNGHKYLLSQIKDKGYDAVICVMSGSFVQRGEYSVCDKKIRAEMAVDSGADLVISIPFPWASAGAELFARGALSVLDGLGCVDAIAFGSETARKEMLCQCADFLSSLTPADIKSVQKDSPKLSYAQARQILAEASLGKEMASLLENPNDILAIEYIKAIKYLNSDIDVVPIKREYASHNGDVTCGSYCSSSHLRELVESGKFEEIDSFVPWDVDILRNNIKSVDKQLYFNFLRGAILSREPNELSLFAENGGGLEYAFYREMLTSDSLDSFFDKIRSRHLTDAKIRRAALFTALGIKKTVFNELPGYTEVLALNDVGKEVLSACRKNARITVLSKTANIKNAPDNVKEQFKLQRKSEMAFETLLK